MEREKYTKEERCVYVYIFEDMNIYVGLTYNLVVRNTIHLNLNNEKSQVSKYIRKSKLNPELKMLTDYIPLNDAIKKEKYYINYYKNKGYKLLNIAKGGGIGAGIRTWTKEKCISEALKFKNRKDFVNKSHSAYQAAYRNSWLDEICSHFEKKKEITIKECQEIVKKYNNYTKFKKDNPKIYTFLYRKKMINEMCSHMKRNIPNFWTKEKCISESKKYENMTLFRRESPSVYRKASKEGWLEEIIESKNEKTKKIDMLKSKTTIISEELHTKLKKHCKKKGVKLNEYIENVLQDHLDFKLEEKSILPMRLKDESGDVRETLICIDVSGDYKNNLPSEIKLMRTIKNETGFIASYKQI